MSDAMFVNAPSKPIVAAGTVTLPAVNCVYMMIGNKGAATVFFSTGDSTITDNGTAGYVLPGADKIYKISQQHTHIAVSGSAIDIQVQVGVGY